MDGHELRTFTEQFEGMRATGGICAIPAGPRNPLGFWDPLYISPRFRPLRGWRTWFRRGSAGGPLLGHATPPIPTLRVRDLLPTFTAPRGGVTFLTPPASRRSGR